MNIDTKVETKAELWRRTRWLMYASFKDYLLHLEAIVGKATFKRVDGGVEITFDDGSTYLMDKS